MCNGAGIYSIILGCGSRGEVPCIGRRDLPYDVAGLDCEHELIRDAIR